MNDKELNNLTRFVKKISNFKPKETPKKPSKQPSKAELGQAYKFDGKRIIEVK